MRFVHGGVFAMGSEDFYPEEAPVRSVRVDGFWIDETPVTNAAFAHFVAATGYVTLAERVPDPLLYPGIPPELAQPGSLVFDPEGEPGAEHALPWWRIVAGADWRHPLGPSSGLDGLDTHPVVHVAYEDAQAYADWAGKALPSEAEWEFAARGGLDRATYAWGDALAPGGAMLANFWQGAFPDENDLLDGWARTSPVRSFPANGYGLFDMIGNVWEWTSDWYAVPEASNGSADATCCIPRDPRGGTKAGSVDPAAPHAPIPRKVIKGGSHLCAPNYCQRYRPAARQPQAIDSAATHIGFRCVVRESQV